MRINHNSLAYTANNNLTTANDKLAAAVERLSSGYKLNSAKDDAAGMAISQKMTAQIRGLERANQNSEDGANLIQTAEATLGELQSMLNRMEELATQAANEILAVEDATSIQQEIDDLVEEINRVTEDMDFNGRKLLNGDVCRRNYSSDTNVTLYDISSAVEAGDYGLTVTADAEQAKISSVGMAGASYVFSAEEAGTITINGMSITVQAGTTMSQVYSDLVYYCDLVQVDAFADDGSGKEVPFEDANGLTFRSQLYGSSQYVEIGCSNPDLAALLGVDSVLDQRVVGKDAEVSFLEDNGERIGFSNTATLTVDGDNVLVTDKDNFEMQFTLTAEAVADNGAIEATVTVLDAGPINLQIGAFEGEHLRVNIPKVNAKTLGIDDLSMYSHELASRALQDIQAASKKISSIRSYLGACQNRLQYTVTNLEETAENMNKALSGIMDTNMAEEMTEYTQHNVLSQSATQMLSKANALPENLLQLIQTN